MYIHFDKLKRANSAKIIQRLWLKKKTPRSMEIPSSSEGNQLPSMDEQKLFNSQCTKLKNYIMSLDHVVRSVKQEASDGIFDYK
jgi:hypothetical protein